MDFGRRHADRRGRAERRRLGADEPAGAAAAGRAGSRPVNPMCPRLEAQLATIDRGGADPAKDDQIRRYQDAATKQQAELDRVTSQAKRMGCDSSGFFSLFSGQSAQCGPVNNQIQQMRANLDQITSSLERLRSGGLGGADRENQRRSVLTALAQNNCGPQYANARAARATSSTICSATTTTKSEHARHRSRPAVRHLPHRLRPLLRRRLFSDLVRDRAGPLSRRRKDLQGALPGGGCDAVRLSQPRRRHEPGGVDQRPTLYVVAERISFPPGVQSVLLLQGRRTDLVRRAEEHRRQGRRRTAGRHHRHRREREEDGAAPAGEGSRDDREEGRRRHHRYRARHAAPDASAPATAATGRRATRSVPSARPSSPRARRPIPRTLRPIRSSRATAACRRARATACRRRETGW